MALSECADHTSYLKLVKLHRTIPSTIRPSILQSMRLKSVERILKQDGDINYRIPNTVMLKSRCPKLIGCTILHLFFCSDDNRILNLLLDHGADFTIKNPEGQTVIHEYINMVSWKLCRDCWYSPVHSPGVTLVLSAHLKRQITENPIDPNSLSHFHAACMTNNVEAIEFFLDNGVSIDQKVNMDSPIFTGYTPLHFATKFVCLEAVKLLLQRGADSLARDARKMTPLHLIISRIVSHKKESSEMSKKCIDIVEELVKSYKNYDAQDDFGLSYLHALCIVKDTSMLERHLNDIEDVNRAVNADSPICPGYTPLHFATLLLNLDSVKLLLAKGADVTIKDLDQNTPLELCIGRRSLEDIYDLLAVHFNNFTLSNGKTKLTDLIVSMRNPSHFRTLLRTLIDANVNIPEDAPLWPGYTTLDLAVICHERCSTDEKINKTMLFELIEECLKNGFDVSAKGVLGQTPMQFAFRRGCTQLVCLMLKYHRGTSNPVDEDGLSHLHIACAANNKDVVEALLKNGANVNCKLRSTFTWNYFGRRTFFCGGSTPLHIAVVIGGFEIAKLLLERGGDLQARDVNGLTAVHRLITSKNGRRVGELLLSLKNLRECVVDGCGLSYLHVACFMDHPDAVKKLLLEPGIEVDRAINCNTIKCKRQYDEYEYRTSDDRYGDPSVEPLFALEPLDGFTPLHMAMWHTRDLQTVKLLLQHGADILAESFTSYVPQISYRMPDEQNYSGCLLYWHHFVEALKWDDNLRRRVEGFCGLTELHLACYGWDLPWIKKLIADGVDVNARIRDDSPFWSGQTPLHMLMDEPIYSWSGDAFTILQLLLSHGADVAISDRQFTPLHLARSSKIVLHDLLEDYQCSFDMIRSLRDFSRNPTTYQGISHFHIACQYHEVEAVEGFLKQGVDVNAKIDYFSQCHAGYTPLHMILSFEGDLQAKVKIVELLLKHGADVHAEDVFGNTPLHCAVKKSAGEQIFRMMFDAGADIDAKNVDGASPLELLLQQFSVTIEMITCFVESGCRINSFNSVTDRGLIPMIIDNLPRNEDVKKLILSSPNIIESDEMGRSAIHNIVSARSFRLWVRHCHTNDPIEELEKLGCDVDYQDKSGRTALHTAVQFKNNQAITALLAAGADINIVDWEGKTAYIDALDVYGVHNQDYRGCSTNDAIDLFTTHVHKLQLAGIHVSDLNKRSQEIVLEKHAHSKRMIGQQRFCNFLDSMEKTKIGSAADVRKYSKMTRANRDAVVEYFESVLKANNDRKSDEFRCLVKLQYRNLLSRSKLVEAAKLALNTILKIPLPDLCSEAIFAFFENWELRNVIKAAN